MNELPTVMEILHWIVATIGFTETLLLMLLGLIWIIYMVWVRRPSPPRGIWRWGIWLPMIFCLEGVRSGIAAKWELYEMMMAAGAFNQPQLDLYFKQAVFGAVKLFIVGLVGTLFLYYTIRWPNDKASQQTAPP